MGWQELLAGLSHSLITGSRSTALKPILSLDGFLLVAIVSLVHFNAPNWLLITTFCALAVSFLVTIFAYLYFLWKNPDALRSEHYALQKMAIERNLIGDNLVGTAVEDQRPRPKLIEGGDLTGR